MNAQLIPDKTLQELYGDSFDLQGMRDRFISLEKTHFALFRDAESPMFFSVPGRTELGGNHTDHNHGKVLAASVDLDTIGAVSASYSTEAVLISEGYPEVRVDVSDTQQREEEQGTTEALVRGIARFFQDKGIPVKGFLANTSSRVLKGSGLSSSAAVEIMIGSIFNELYADGSLEPLELAKAGQFAENRYFGKPSGLMDQIACACGGAACIDFQDPEHPAIETLEADFASMGYALCVVDTGGNHADLTDCYASIPGEMKGTAQLFGEDHLRQLDEQFILSQAQTIRKQCGDRAFLRCLHFFQDTRRASQQAEALRSHDIGSYLELVRQSGRSSILQLQNIYPPHLPEEQGISAALAMTETFFAKYFLCGACRVHGGGFAGTIQAYIPLDFLEKYRIWMEGVFGKGCVTPLKIRNLRAGRIA